MSKIKGQVLALGLYQGSGGVNKSIRAFYRVLGGDMISWVDPDEIANSPLIFPDTTLVHGSRFPILKGLLYPRRADAANAEKIVGEANYVSCHSFWRWHNLWLLMAARKHGVPYGFVPHGSLDPYVFETAPLVKKAFLAFGGRRFIEQAGCVIFSTNREREKALRLCQPKRTKVIYWPLDEADFKVVRDPEAGLRVRTRLGMGKNARCLLYFGRLHPMKRPLETIDAVAATDDQQIHLLIVGNEHGTTLEDCRQRARQKGIGSRVHVIGPVYGPEVAGYFSASDAYISLSFRENFNFTAAECMAASLPVILSPGNDLAGELANVDCGWMLKDNEIETVADAIKMCCQCSDAILRGKGIAARQWAADRLHFEVFKDHLAELVADIVQKDNP